LAQQSGGVVTAPDAFFLCAGASTPKYFVEYTPQELEHGMDQSYWVQAWSAHSIFRKLVEAQRPGKILFVGSSLSCMSFLGWGSYTPGKHALKGLAETLRSEGLLYNIHVGIFFAPTMDSPGLAEEMKTKPSITKQFEEGDAILTCDKAAEAMLHGAEDGNHHIAATFLGNVFYNASRGAAPLTNPLTGPFYDCVSWVSYLNCLLSCSHR
jgi:3-dehydrosphinganine reductase